MEASLAAAVERYIELNLHTNAVFLAEKLVCESKTDYHVGLLAKAYHRSGQTARAIALLQSHVSDPAQTPSPQSIYLLALCCYETGRLSDAESTLSSACRTQEMPNGAAGMYLMGCICRKLNRTKKAIEYFTESLQHDPFLWTAYEQLCELGCSISPSAFFRCGPSASTTQQSPATPILSTPVQPVHSQTQRFSSSSTSSSRKKAMSRTFTEAEESTPSSLSTRRLNFDENTPATPVFTAKKSSEEQVLELLHTLGTAYRHLCAYECREAISVFESLPLHHFNASWVQHQVARAHFEMAQYREVATIFRAIHENEPDRMDGLSMYSTALWHLKEEVELSYLTNRITQTNKRSSETWCVAGNCFSLQKEHDTALLFFQRAIQVDPSFPYAYTLAGHEYILNEDFDKATGCFQQALRLNPRHYNALHGLAMINSRQEKFELAASHFRQALAIHPRSSLLYCFLGVVWHALKKDNDAMDAFNKALLLEPSNLPARFHRANLLMVHDRLQEALQELQCVQTYAPKEYTVHLKMGKLLKRMGRYDAALRAFNTALHFNPKEVHEIKAHIDQLYEDEEEEKENQT